jgi:hypothetical protein
MAGTPPALISAFIIRAEKSISTASTVIGSQLIPDVSPTFLFEDPAASREAMLIGNVANESDAGCEAKSSGGFRCNVIGAEQSSVSRTNLKAVSSAAGNSTAIAGARMGRPNSNFGQ